MDVKVEITPEAVEKHIVEAIIASSLGEKIEKAVQDALGGLTRNNWQDKGPLIVALENQVNEVVVETVRTKFAERIRETVKEKLTDELVEKAADKMWQSFMSRL